MRDELTYLLRALWCRIVGHRWDTVPEFKAGDQSVYSYGCMRCGWNDGELYHS